MLIFIKCLEQTETTSLVFWLFITELSEHCKRANTAICVSHETQI